MNLQVKHFINSVYQEESFELQSNNTKTLIEGNNIQLWDKTLLTVMETPGHDWSCLSFTVGMWIFTGDSFLPKHNVVTTFPKSS